LGRRAAEAVAVVARGAVVIGVGVDGEAVGVRAAGVGVGAEIGVVRPCRDSQIVVMGGQRVAVGAEIGLPDC
jgi:hypothetical protein